MHTRNWTCFLSSLIQIQPGMVCRACTASEGTEGRHEDVPCLITSPHYSWFTSRLSYQLQAILINSQASHCRILEDFNFIKLPIFKEHFQWGWQHLYWQIQSEKREKPHFKSYLSQPSCHVWLCKNLSVFQVLLPAYSKPLQRIFPWVTSHAATHTSPHLQTIQGAGWQSCINPSYLKGDVGFEFDLKFF